MQDKHTNQKKNELSAEAKASSNMVILSPDQLTKEVKVLLLTRSDSSRSWPGALVFPGGLIEAQDEQLGSHFLQQHDWHTLVQAWGMAGQNHLFATLGAGLRETLEECGLDLANQIKANQPFRLIAHWLTPFALKKRYDTYTWGLVLDEPVKDLKVDGVEIAEAAWWSISSALSAYQTGELDLPVPVLIILTELHSMMTDPPHILASELIESFSNAAHLKPIQPILVKDEGLKLYLPSDHRYKECAKDEVEAEISRAFWKQNQHYLKQVTVQKKSDLTEVKRWVRVAN